MTPSPAAGYRFVAAAAAFLCFSCGEEQVVDEAPAPAYTQPAPDYTTVGNAKTPPKIQFSDIATSAGITFEHETGAVGDKWMPETMGSGCAFLDYDGDDDEDVLLVNSAHWQPADRVGPGPTSKLFRNEGGGRYADVTAAVGLDFTTYGMGVAAADYDGDDDLDIYLTTLGANMLLRNERARFADVADAAGVAGRRWQDEAGRDHPEWSTGTLWFDADNDGWLDLLVSNYVRWSPDTDLFYTFDGKNKSYATPQQYPGSTCRLYHNRGDGTFEEVTEQAGLSLPDAKSMGVAVADFDDDGHIDVVITNDTQPNFLLRNLGDGRFEEIGLAAGIGYDESGRARAGMGVDVAALKNDGVPTIGIGNFSREALSLYRRQKAGVFLDVAGRNRLVQPTLPTLTFGLRFFDFDLDGHQDLILANGHIEPEINAVQKEIEYAQRPQLFWNDGDGALLDVSETAGPLFAQALVARGLAVADAEGDGDPDVLISVNGGAAHLLRNDVGGDSHHALALRLRGKHPNIGAIGARATAISGDLVQELMVKTGSSYLSQSSPELVFGLGSAAAADRLEIEWPDGSSESVAVLEAGVRYWIEQGRGVVRSRPFD